MVQYDINKQVLFMPSPCKGSELAIKNLLEKAEFFLARSYNMILMSSNVVPPQISWK